MFNWWSNFKVAFSCVAGEAGRTASARNRFSALCSQDLEMVARVDSVDLGASFVLCAVNNLHSKPLPDSYLTAF